MMPFFIGNLALIFNPRIIIDILSRDPAAVVFSLNEDNDEYINPDNPRVVMGTMLLPQVDTMWALSRGDLDLFQMSYYQYLTSPEVTEFIFMILGMMHRGNKVILYYPDEDSEVIEYLYRFFDSNFGIHISVPSRNSEQYMFRYDVTKVPMHVCGIYYSGMLSANEFLYFYPSNMIIPDDIYNKLIYDLQPYGNNIKEKIDMINTMRNSIQNSNNLNKEFPFY